MELTRTLARHLVTATYADLPPDAREATKLSILDTLGVMMPPTTLEQACITLGEFALDAAGKQESSLFTGGKAPTWIAAFINGSLTHALDYDDGMERPPHHPTASTLPSALAVAEMLGGVDGKEFVTAVALGNDLAIRLASCVKGKLVEDYPWFPITTFGLFSSAAAAGRLLRLSEEQMINALGIAAGRVSGITESISAPESEIRAIRDGFTNKEGTLAALLASRGIAASNNGIETVLKVLYRGEFDPGIATKDLGRKFRGTDVHLKLWPSCRETHGHIQAALGLVRDHNLVASRIAEVIITVERFGEERLCEPIDAKRHPTVSIGAKFSLPFTVATALAKGKVEIGHFLLDNLKDPEVSSLADRITYKVDPTFGIVTPAIVEVTLDDGTTVSNRVDHVHGDPGNPLSREDVVEKFKDCARYAEQLLDPDMVDPFIELCLALDDVSDVRQLSSLLQTESRAMAAE